VNSWLIIFLECGALALLLSSNIIRSVNPLSIAAEAILAVLFISIAIVLAGASGPHRWACVTLLRPLLATRFTTHVLTRPCPLRLQQNEVDACSAQTNPHSAQVYFLADILGERAARTRRHGQRR